MFNLHVKQQADCGIVKISKSNIKVVILCGGRGKRAYPYTDYLPKPMMPVNGQPIVMHVMRIYAMQGFSNFVLSLGYRKEVIIDYFHRKHLDWNVELVDTGDDTDTGGRIEKVKHLLGDVFMATYADGLAQIRLDSLLYYHQSHAGLATVTSVPLVSQYGTLETQSDGRITAFREKPVLREYRINAGFFVFDHEVFEHWQGAVLERDVLPGLTRKGLVYGYHSEGLFKSMDTYKDQQDIEVLLGEGRLDSPPGDPDRTHQVETAVMERGHAPGQRGDGPQGIPEGERPDNVAATARRN